MKEHYDPEDLELLMRERRFEELLDEEKAYVLRHMGNAEEYEEVRSTLLAVAAHMDKESDLEPDPAIKNALMQEFATASDSKEEKAGFTIWLNSVAAFLLPADKRFYAKPGLQLAFTMVLVLVGFFFFYNPIAQDHLALNEDKGGTEQVEEKGKETTIEQDEAPASTETGALEDEESPVTSTLSDNKDLNNQDGVLNETSRYQIAETVEEETLADEDAEMDFRAIDLAAQSTSTVVTGSAAVEDDRRAELSKNEADRRDLAQENNREMLAGYTDSLPIRMGNMAVPNVAESFDQSLDLEEVQLATVESRSRANKFKDTPTNAPVKSVNMRQYSALIGVLHTAL